CLDPCCSFPIRLRLRSILFPTRRSSDLWTVPAALGVAKADPGAQVVALSGDYDFQFMIEELAVGAQHRIPYVHVLVNNANLGLRSEEHTSELQSRENLVCRLLLEKKKQR